MQNELGKLLAALLALLGPATSETPKELQLAEGDQIVAIGDSITQGGGYLRDADAVLAAQYPDLKLPKIINVGIGGQKAEDLVKRFEKDVIDRGAKLVTISIGINDVWHRLGKPHEEQVLAAYKENVSKMVDMAQAKKIKVILLTPTLINEDAKSPGNERLAQYIAASKQIAKDKQCGISDLHQMFLDVLAKKPEDVKGNWLTSDGVHMNPRGDALMAIGMLRALGVADGKISLPQK